MIELKHIVVATDLSSLSKHAVRYACELASQFNATLDILYVIWHPFTEYAQDEIAQAVKSFDEFEKEHRAAAEKSLAELPIEPLTDKSRVTSVILTGAPAPEILSYASENDVDLLVLGTHGRSGLMHILMGSVAEKVVQHAPCPVLTVRDPEFRFTPAPTSSAATSEGKSS